jgi:hypothetical protein
MSTDRQLLQMAELAQELKSIRVTTQGQAEVIANASNKTIDRIFEGTDENFSVTAFLHLNRKIENSYRQQKQIGKGKSIKKEVNIVDKSGEDSEETSFGTISDLAISVEEKGYAVIEDKISVQQTYEKMINKLDEYGYAESELVDALLACETNVKGAPVEGTMIKIRTLCTLPDFSELLKEFLGYENAFSYVKARA